jgi:poly(hydroxyalkanoate) depolymerase family esterase
MSNRVAGMLSRVLPSAILMGVLGITWAAPRVASAATLVEVTNFGRNPTNLRMHLWVPDSVRPNPAVLVAVHFCTGTGPVFFQGTEFATLANQHGFIVIYPSATRSGNCFDVSTASSLTHTGNSDPVAIVSMVQHVLQNFGADPSRVFVTGASSGAMMTNVLLGAYPDVFKAGAAFMGVPFGCFATTDGSMWNNTCANGQLIRTAQQWGDLVRAAFPGFTGPRPRMQLWHGTEDATLRFPNFNEEIKQWTNVHGLSQTPALTDSPQANWTRTRYGGTGIDAPVEAISIQGMGHNLPAGGMAARVIQFFGLDRPPIGNPDITPPSVPVNLAASNVTASGAVLSWSPSTDNVGVAGYRILQQQGTSPAVQIGTSTGTTFTVTGLAASTTYSFSVRAFDAAGAVSPSSSTVVVTTAAAGPGPGPGPTPTPTPGGTPTVTITNQWATGFCATLTVANNTSAAITWQVTITVERPINNLWNGTFTQTGSSATIRGVSWNAVLQPGQSTNTVGFCAQD